MCVESFEVAGRAKLTKRDNSCVLRRVSFPLTGDGHQRPERKMCRTIRSHVQKKN